MQKFIYIRSFDQFHGISEVCLICEFLDVYLFIIGKRKKFIRINLLPRLMCEIAQFILWMIKKLSVAYCFLNFPLGGASFFLNFINETTCSGWNGD